MFPEETPMNFKRMRKRKRLERIWVCVGERVSSGTDSFSVCKCCSGPQPFWHQGPVLWKTIFPLTRK